MEERIRAIEAQLASLNATISTSRWWLIVAGAALVAWLGATSLYTVPNQITDLLTKNGMIEAGERISHLESSAISSSEQIDRILADLSAEPRTLYSCPANADLRGNGGDWASFGCNGQISTESQCVNRYFKGGAKSEKFECTPVGIYFKK